VVAPGSCRLLFSFRVVRPSLLSSRILWLDNVHSARAHILGCDSRSPLTLYTCFHRKFHIFVVVSSYCVLFHTFFFRSSISFTTLFTQPSPLIVVWPLCSCFLHLSGDRLGGPRQPCSPRRLPVNFSSLVPQASVITIHSCLLPSTPSCTFVHCKVALPVPVCSQAVVRLKSWPRSTPTQSSGILLCVFCGSSGHKSWFNRFSPSTWRPRCGYHHSRPATLPVL
jgi:hypothetical protein